MSPTAIYITGTAVFLLTAAIPAFLTALIYKADQWESERKAQPLALQHRNADRKPNHYTGIDR